MDISQVFGNFNGWSIFYIVIALGGAVFVVSLFNDITKGYRQSKEEKKELKKFESKESHPVNQESMDKIKTREEHPMGDKTHD